MMRLEVPCEPGKEMETARKIADFLKCERVFIIGQGSLKNSLFEVPSTKREKQIRKMVPVYGSWDCEGE